MADQRQNLHGTPRHATTTDHGHPLPRRTSPENSVTLLHHRLARDATQRAQRSAARAQPPMPRRESSESHGTRRSNGTDWFNKSNRNPTATYDDPNNMDVDPPFFQQETDSSNELELPPRIPSHPYGQTMPERPHLHQRVTQSSSADDYRSVIDDLTIENQRLKEELKRYKQLGPDMMKKDKLFEIKVHGLPSQKKRELEATLRDFASSLEGSSESTSHRRTKPGRHLQNLYSSRQTLSKHASSSSSNSRPVDSAYASMSTGFSAAGPQSSTGPSVHGKPTLLRSKTSYDGKVERYLLDTPEGLLPRHTPMTDKDKKKLVVRRLEQIFTGKIGGRNMHRNQSMPSLEAPVLTGASAIPHAPNLEAVREARIQASDASSKKARSRDNLSTGNSGEQTESGGAHGAGDGRSSDDRSPPDVPPPEQRPTRPWDLDPDRVQVPSENIDYIRHLGLVTPEFLVDKKTLRHDVSADADGWVYLNLLCNLAQLHMVNVTPAFIRSAVSEKSTKFQLSADGRKIRWRGGTRGTKFSSDSSSDHSPKSASDASMDESAREGQRKRQRTSVTGDAMASNASTKDSKSGLGQVSASSNNSFHYKPLFVRQSSHGETASDGSESQASMGVADDSSPNKSPWDLSGSGSGQRKKRRRDGAIIYYSGAPFCTDLSGDPGDMSTTYMTSNGQERDLDLGAFRPIPHRSASGSSMLVRPLSDDKAIVSEAMDMDLDSPPELVTDDGDSRDDGDFEFPWCDEPTSVAPISFPLEPRLEACGLGGVMPEDHFAVFCHTRHPVMKHNLATRARSEDITDVAARLASMSTSSSAPQRRSAGPVKMTYLSGRMRRFKPVGLPPPAMYIPPFSTDSDSDGSDDDSDLDEDKESVVEASSESRMSRLGNPRQSDDQYEGGMSSNDQDDEDSAVNEDMVIADLASGNSEREQPARRVSGSADAAVGKETSSSVATAGGRGSGYSSSMEEGASSK